MQETYLLYPILTSRLKIRNLSFSLDLLAVVNLQLFVWLQVLKISAAEIYTLMENV